MARAKKKLLSVTIREATASFAAPGGRVDRAAGIIYGVKVVGRFSPNTHGLTGIDGTEYEPQALEAALPIYEGVKVNLNHADRKNPGQDRDVEDGIGQLVNCRIQEGEMFADLHILKAHPFAEQLFEAAEKMPLMYGLSHNAGGKGEVKGGKFVVSEIPYVRSVDLVRDPATVRGLFESQERTMSKTLRQLIESTKHGKKLFAKELADKASKRWLEGPLLESGEDGNDDGKDWRGHLKEAIGKMCESDDEEDHKKARKILGMLTDRPGDQGKATETPEDDSDGQDPNKKQIGKEDAHGFTGEDAEQAEKNAKAAQKTKESLDLDARLRKLETENATLKKEQKIRSLCESAGWKPGPAQMSALMILPDDKQIKALIEESKATAAPAPKKKIGARTGRHFTQTMQESRSADTPKDAKEFAALVLS